MAEQRGDRFEGHAPVDALGGEGVAQRVGVDVADAGAAGDGGDVAVDGAAVHGLMVVAFDEQAGGGRPAPGPVVVDQPDEHRVQRDGAVVVELAERDAQPPGVAEAIHGVVAQPADLADAHPGAGQQFDDQPAPPVRVDGEGGHELGGGGIVEELRERFIGLGDVSGEASGLDAGRRGSPSR